MAIADLDQAITATPLSLSFVVIAVVKYRMGDPQGAVADMDAAREIQPLSYPHQVNRQHYLKQLAQDDSATEHSLDADKDLSTADALYCQAHAKHGKDDVGRYTISLGQSNCIAAKGCKAVSGACSRADAHVQACRSLARLAGPDGHHMDFTCVDSTWNAVDVLCMCGVCNNKLPGQSAMSALIVPDMTRMLNLSDGSQITNARLRALIATSSSS